MSRRLIVETISALFILVFVYTALSKFLDFRTFQFVLKQSPLIGNYNTIIARLVPVVELIIAALIFFPKSRKFGLVAALTIMVLFTCYIGYMLVYTPNLPCSCGGVISKMTWPQHFAFNIVLTLLAVLAIFLKRGGDFEGRKKSRSISVPI